MKMSKKLKIAYLSYYDSDVIRYWSGSVYFMRKSLEQANTEVVPVHNLGSKIDDFYKIKSLYYKIIGKQYHRPREISINKRAAQIAEKKIKQLKPDVILSSGALEIAQIDTNIPLTFWSDATFNNIVNYYPDYSNLAPETFRNGEYLEKMSLGKANLQFFSSDWASNDSINHYKSDPTKVKSIPFGANILELPNYNTIKERIANKKFDTINFLFVGVDWIRKGGDIALKIVEKLRQNGINAKLQVVGCTPNLENKPDFVEIYGYLVKANQDDYTTLVRLYEEAHFFMMPSRYESFGIAVCEANANGLPVIGAKTGGLQHIVKENINGFVFDYKYSESEINRLTEQIISLISDREKLLELGLSSYNEYSTNLNWDVSGKKIVDLLMNIA